MISEENPTDVYIRNGFAVTNRFRKKTRPLKYLQDTAGADHWLVGPEVHNSSLPLI